MNLCLLYNPEFLCMMLCQRYNNTTTLFSYPEVFYVVKMHKSLPRANFQEWALATRARFESSLGPEVTAIPIWKLLFPLKHTLLFCMLVFTFLGIPNKNVHKIWYRHIPQKTEMMLELNFWVKFFTIRKLLKWFSSNLYMCWQLWSDFLHH